MVLWLVIGSERLLEDLDDSFLPCGSGGKLFTEYEPMDMT